MNFLKTIFITLLFIGVSYSGFSQNLEKVSSANSDKQTIELTINNEKVFIQSANPNARVDIFSIIGSKVSSVDVKSGFCEGTITLPKGYYILKVDSTTRKIAVK